MLQLSLVFLYLFEKFLLRNRLAIDEVIAHFQKFLCVVAVARFILPHIGVKQGFIIVPKRSRIVALHDRVITIIYHGSGTILFEVGAVPAIHRAEKLFSQHSNQTPSYTLRYR